MLMFNNVEQLQNHKYIHGYKEIYYILTTNTFTFSAKQSAK